MNKTNDHAVRVEAVRLFAMPLQQARQTLSDRIARAYLATGEAQWEQLDFNARLTTELRELADAADVPSLWRRG
jgi:hypothetical protein